MMKNKKGNIKISKTLLDNIDEYKEALSKLFSVFFPLFIEHKFEYAIYYGYSEYFDEVEEGCNSPFYSAVFTDNNGVLTMEIIKE
jgi:hypothetical protein